MGGREEEVQETLQNANEVRRSVIDPSVFLYYRKAAGHHFCVVVKHLNDEGFLITAYLTEVVKAGETIWKR
jgi:hypothetical protein